MSNRLLTSEAQAAQALLYRFFGVWALLWGALCGASFREFAF